MLDPIIDGRHGGFGPDDKHKTDLDYTKITGDAFDENYVISSRVRTGRSIKGKASFETNYCILFFFLFFSMCLIPLFSTGALWRSLDRTGCVLSIFNHNLESYECVTLPNFLRGAGNARSERFARS